MRVSSQSIIYLFGILAVFLSGCGKAEVEEPVVEVQVEVKEVEPSLPENGVLAEPGEDLMATLKMGKDLYLKKGETYLITERLKYYFPGQKIMTFNAKRISDYATLKATDKESSKVISGAHVDNILLQNVIIDGNCYELGALNRKKRQKFLPPMAFFGGKGAEGQVVRQCVFINTRSFTSLKIHQGSSRCVAENNIVIGAGADPRGNGRTKGERPFRWGDGISCSGEDAVVRNNIVIDCTDVGIVLFGAPNTLVESNVVSAFSRESLGGINLVDPHSSIALNKEQTLFNYNKLIVRNNYVDAVGSRIHISIPIGPEIWTPAWKDKVIQGGTVINNTIAGGASAYGIVVNGVDKFTVSGNKSIAQYSGIGEGGRTNPPAGPGAFLYAADAVKDSTLQEEFKAADGHLMHLLRANFGTKNADGYRIYDYAKHEITAVINAAYLEMLHRAPTATEMLNEKKWLKNTRSTADSLRIKLSKKEEFIKREGELDPENLQAFRIKQWLTLLDEHFDPNDTKVGAAEKAYLKTLMSFPSLSNSNSSG